MADRFSFLQLDEELKQQKEAACFKARPNTVVSQEPFVPKREKKSVIGSILCVLEGLGKNCETS